MIFASKFNKLLIYSAGDFAREIAWLAQSACIDPKGLDIRFIDDKKQPTSNLSGFPVINYEKAKAEFLDWPIINAIGQPFSREKVVQRYVADGFKQISLRHPSAEIGPRNTFGKGCIICANCSITCDITFGNNVSLNLNCTVGHDAIIGDNVSISPMTSISGRVVIEKNVNIGAGVTIINGRQDKPLIIGEGATIGAGSVVVKNVPPNITVVGVPAKPLNISKPI